MPQRLNELEKKALKLIKEQHGILQSQLWRVLGLDSREGSRLVLKLVKKGLVKREPVSVKGRRTYKLYAVESKPRISTLFVDLSTALEVPCLTCPWFQECGPNNFHDPRTCPLLDIWLHRKLEQKKMRENTGDGNSSRGGERLASPQAGF